MTLGARLITGITCKQTKDLATGKQFDYFSCHSQPPMPRIPKQEYTACDSLELIQCSSENPWLQHELVGLVTPSNGAYHNSSSACLYSSKDHLYGLEIFHLYIYIPLHFMDISKQADYLCYPQLNTIVPNTYFLNDSPYVTYCTYGVTGNHL